MNATRPLRLATGVALLGVGGSLIARSLSADNGAGEHAAASRSGRAPAVPYGSGSRIEKVFTIERSASDLYAYWRDFANLPQVMSHLRRVEVLDERRSRWHAHGPMRSSASWTAEIIDDTPGRRIAWRSTDGTVPNAGTVTFTDAPAGRGTEVRVEIEWSPPGGKLGASFAQLLGGDPGLMVQNDLRRFKATMEAGTPALNGTDVTQ